MAQDMSGIWTSLQSQKMLHLAPLMLDVMSSSIACTFSMGCAFPMPFTPVEHDIACCPAPKETEHDAGQLISLTLASNIAPTNSYENLSSSRYRPKIAFSGSWHSEIMIGRKHETGESTGVGMVRQDELS